MAKTRMKEQKWKEKGLIDQVKKLQRVKMRKEAMKSE